jgi:iron-sulfur cluster repair protein YtfE (RIC family)
MDPTRLLEADHRDVEHVIARLEKAEDGDRQPLVDELVTSLLAHMQLEEDVVYPAIRPVTGDEEVDEGITEHDLARKTLREVQRLSPDTPGFGAALAEVKAGIEHHVEEEEHDLFPKVRRDGQKQLDDMATPFMKLRMELGLPMKADALAAASTKDELVREARSAGVDGASSMTKKDLAKVVAKQMA